MKSVSIAVAAVLLALCAAAAPPSLPPLRCLDVRGRPFPDASQPLRVDSTVTGARVIYSEWPTLPEGPQRVQGAIVIESIVDQRGRVCAARLLKGRGPLAEASLAALKRWKFEPARVNGRPFPFYFTMGFWICPH